MESTKRVNCIYTDEKSLSKELIEGMAQNELTEICDKLDYAASEIFYLIDNNDWLNIGNKNVYFSKKYKLLLPDLKSYKCVKRAVNLEWRPVSLKFSGLDGRLPNKREAIKIFYMDKSSVYLNKVDKPAVMYDGEPHCLINPLEVLSFGWRSDKYASIFPVFDIDAKCSYVENFLKYGLIPNELTEDNKKVFKEAISLYKKGFITYDKSFKATKELTEQIAENKPISVGGIVVSRESITQKIGKFSEQGIKLCFSQADKAILLKPYLECDKTRADIEPYDLKRLEDPNLGHWELWESEKSDGIKLNTDLNLVARNPVIDVKDNCIVGIDFGTKSTIVVYQDGTDNTQPMRIGMGKFNREVRQEDFENPTVMEFIDVKSFIQAYNTRSGRPFTSWNDLTISHTAFNSLTDVNAKSDEFYSFFYDLKQWAGDNTRRLKLKDKNGCEMVLPAYTEIQPGEFDPIEIYAYYIGLYINNMHNGIYLNYLLSFPVTYDKTVREHILQSFERGIKKSLPNAVLENAEKMKNFHIRQGASEPAAYAICALQQYGFDPDEGEEDFYGIFDFGGGTTDFDFGVWKSADINDELYDYEINHFGAGGDKYLGGENLLELLAFTVFCDNIDICRKEKIAFQKPAECIIPESIKFFVSESQEAKMNMKQLMEKLRPFWERKDSDYAKDYGEGIRVHLFDRDGNPKMNLSLAVDVGKLDDVLYKRIEKGVRNFFEALKLTFGDRRISSTAKAEGVNIFLAGNSSKSPIVREIFDKYIQANTEAIAKNIRGDDREFFKVFPPLGTSEAAEIQKARRVETDDFITAPTGKTGVAFGLIDGRKGGRIKVVSEISEAAETQFAYYLGIPKKKRFRVVIPRNSEYNKWYRFISAANADFEIYYTTLPEATTNALPIRDIAKKFRSVSAADADKSIYIRLIKPTVIEYAVGSDEKSVDEQNAVTVELN